MQRKKSSWRLYLRPKRTKFYAPFDKEDKVLDFKDFANDLLLDVKTFNQNLLSGGNGGFPINPAYKEKREERKGKILSLVAQAQPPISAIIRDLSSEASEIVAELEEIFPEVPIFTEYKKISFLYDEYTQEDLVEASFEDLESLKLDYWLNQAAGLNKIIKPNLKSLSIDFRDYEDELASSMVLEGLDVSNLEHFSAKHLKDEGNLFPLIHHRLRSLTLCECDLEKPKINSLNFENLEYLSLNSVALDDQTLKMILDRAPNLQSLELINCEGLTDDFAGSWDCGLIRLSKDPEKLSPHRLFKCLEYIPSYALFEENIYFMDAIGGKPSFTKLPSTHIDELDKEFPASKNKYAKIWSKEKLEKIRSLTGQSLETKPNLPYLWMKTAKKRSMPLS